MFNFRKSMWIPLFAAGMLFFGSCQSGTKAPPSPPDTGQTSTAAKEEANGMLTLIKDGTAAVTVVAENNTGATLAAAMERVTGVAPPTATPEHMPADGIRLFVLNASGKDPADLPAGGNYFGYRFALRGSDCYLTAYSDRALEEAAAALAERLPSYYENGCLTVSSASAFSVPVAECWRRACTVPVLPGSRCEGLYDCSDSLYQVICRNVTAEAFAAWCNTLSEAGYTEKTRNTRADNDFLTYTTASGELLYASRIGHSSEARIYVSRSYILPPEEESYQTVCTPLVKQLDASGTTQNEGMGYIFRLSDGRFIIVDGGYKSNAAAKEIYDFLKANAPDPAHIRIAAWYISHYHGDHIGALIRFAENYGSDPTVTVEAFLANQCLTNSMIEFCNTEGGAILTHATTLRTYYPDAVFYKPLAGQRYVFADAKIDILYTISDFMPETIANEPDATPSSPKKGDYNIESTVSIFTVKNTTFFFMADTTRVACDEMCARYGETLKSDYVQISHHGIGKTNPNAYEPRRENSTQEIYRLIAPDYAFLPCSSAKKDERMAFTVNKYLKSFLTKYWCAGDEGGDVLLEIS